MMSDAKTWHVRCRQIEKELSAEKDKVDALEADNAALREQLEQIRKVVDFKVVDLDNGRTVLENVMDLKKSFKQVYDSYQDAANEMSNAQTERDALRLKVQGLDRTLADVYAQRDGLQRDLTTIETLVKALPKVEGQVMVRGRFIDEHHPTLFWQIVSTGSEEFSNALAALLTYRQGMGG